MVYAFVPPPPPLPCVSEGVKQFSTLDVKTICERFNLWLGSALPAKRREGGAGG